MSSATRAAILLAGATGGQILLSSLAAVAVGAWAREELALLPREQRASEWAAEQPRRYQATALLLPTQA